MSGTGVEENTLGDEADELTPGRGHAMSGRLGPNGFVRAEERCPVDIDQIHRDLRLAVDLEAEGFDIAESTGGATHRLGNLFRDGEVRGGAEVDVVGDEEGASADGDCTGGRMHGRRAEIRGAGRITPDRVAPALAFAP